MIIMYDKMQVLHGLLLELAVRPTTATLLEFVYNRDYVQLGELISDLFALYEHTTITLVSDQFDGHNAFEEIVISFITCAFTEQGWLDDNGEFDLNIIDPWCDSSDPRQWLEEKLK